MGINLDGMIIEPGAGSPTVCDIEFDLQLDLTASGTVVMGTAVTKLRKLVPNPVSCGAIGAEEKWTVINGTVGSSTIAFSFPNPDARGGTIDFSGTFTDARMTGTVVSFAGRRGTFVVNRQ